jgi:RNA polymerase sigma-70 factor, ECF subfamily
MGSPQALQELYVSQLQYVWNSLRRLGVPPSDVEDLAHEVFMRAFRMYDRYDPARPIRPWLFGIAYHVAIDFMRLSRHRTELSQDDGELPAIADPAPGPDQEASRSEERGVLLRLLESMDADRRSVLMLHELSGHSVPEIAEALGVPVNTAYSRLRLARADFEAAVERWQRESGHD